ncbi:magnesium transporter [Oceanibacterium hippocampi]|uniref:Magnesium transporter MgtE n=1 Tax=Oceanibacterium hippocampi TaxID=745714 RepID=A0A1Y5SH07_9PROT|nr:magnesium transporter [Oceanibacterium hippocampi]SLN40637.1 Magnesium transporter MgtE [Oceanibacterium hippocampi]
MSETPTVDAEVRPEAEDQSETFDRMMREVSDLLERHDMAGLVDYVQELHSADIADLIEQLHSDERATFIAATRGILDAEVFIHLDEIVRDEVLEYLRPEELAAVVSELDTDDAVYLIEDMDEADQREVLAAVTPEDRAALEEGLGYGEDTAGRLMQRDLISVPEFWTIGQTIDYLRETDDLPDEFYEIFVVDPRHRPIGSVPLNRAMRSKRPVRISEIMEAEPRIIPVDMDQEEVAYIFKQYRLTSAPVVDATGRLIGVITVDDVVEIIEEEAGEDILRLAGVADDDLFDTVLSTTRTRFTWLLVNLGTAVLASIVIGLFDATMEQVIALAVLMPIVASMGGNAGTQTLTVTVRAIATRDLTSANALRLLNKEFLISLINGVLFAVLVGLVAWAWFGVPLLGGVIALAMIINMVIAGISGMLVPMALDRLNIDPAIASSVFVTTITDIVGFFAFLGLAALVLL